MNLSAKSQRTLRRSLRAAWVVLALSWPAGPQAAEGAFEQPLLSVDAHLALPSAPPWGSGGVSTRLWATPKVSVAGTLAVTWWSRAQFSGWLRGVVSGTARRGWELGGGYGYGDHIDGLFESYGPFWRPAHWAAADLAWVRQLDGSKTRIRLFIGLAYLMNGADCEFSERFGPVKRPCSIYEPYVALAAGLAVEREMLPW